MFCFACFCMGNALVTAGNSSVTGEFPSHRLVTWSFDVFFDLRLNKWLSKQLRRRWFETPSRSLWRHCNVVPNSDPVMAAVGSFGVQRVTLVQCWIGETGQIGRGYGRNGLKFGTLLYPDYHSLKLAIFCPQRKFKFVVSDHPWSMKYTFFIRMSDLHAMPITNINHSACYTVEMGVSAGDLTRITLDNNHAAYKHICLQGIGCVCVKNYPPEIMQPSSSTRATIVSAEIKMVQPSSMPHFSFAIITSYRYQITPTKNEDNLEMKV